LLGSGELPTAYPIYEDYGYTSDDDESPDASSG